MNEIPLRQKTGIRRKVILIICLSTMTVMLAGIALGYFFGYNALHGMVGDVHRKLSQLLAGQVTQALDNEMARITAFVGEPYCKDAVMRANAGYDTTAPAAVDTSRPVKDYTENAAAAGLKSAVAADTNIVEAAIFDKAGALIAASGKTKAFFPTGLPKDILSGRIGVLIGDVEFDEAAGAWVIPVEVPIRDRDGGVIGMFRASLAVGKFLSFLNAFMVDKTGRAVLLDGKGNVIYHPGVIRTNAKLYNDRDYGRLITSKGKYATMRDPNAPKRTAFVAFSEVMPPVLLENDKVWRVIIDQNAEEVFRPLNIIFLWATAAVGFLFVITVGIGYVFSGVLVKPILELNKSAIEIMKGNWDYKVDIHTGDEIEGFADAFREMVSNIQAKQAQLSKAKDELEKLSKGLEVKVKERTVNLTMAKDRMDKYAKELEAALMVKTDFISMASHELRTPLAAIKEGIGIVLSGKTGEVNERQAEFLDMAKRNLDRLTRLITDILDFQKLEYGKMTLKMEPHDINEVVREVANIMMTLAAEKKLELVTELAMNLPPVTFDKDKITQVVTNLLNNAIKFTDKGRITVTTGMGSNVIQVSVADTGPGIKKENIPLLFQKFTQLETGLERKTGGSGLGLTISKEIIEIHKGKIWVESTMGEGTTFYFVLPIKERRVNR